MTRVHLTEKQRLLASADDAERHAATIEGDIGRKNWWLNHARWIRRQAASKP